MAGKHRRSEGRQRLVPGQRQDAARFPAAPRKAGLPSDYSHALGEIKRRIREERLRVVLAANAAMVLLYWDIGRTILDRQDSAGWGAKVIDRLAADLREAFLEMKGFSPRNLKYMRAFAVALPKRSIVQEALAQIFAFLGTADPRREREIERALGDHIQRFLSELGTGFAFVGRQVPLEVGDQDFQIDLLFYHLKLRCYVVVELKPVPFDPAFVGQLNLYLSAADDLLRHPDDQPTIGLLLCREKNKLVVEYALRHLKRPIGVAGWETEFVGKLPKALKGSLPTVEEIEAELSGKPQPTPRPRRKKP